MCEHCRNIQTWRKFDAPKDYLACIAYILSSWWDKANLN